MLEAVPREHNLQLYMRYAGMAELADALDSGSSLCKEVQVQVLLPAPTKKRSNAPLFLLVCVIISNKLPATFGVLRSKWRL